MNNLIQDLLDLGHRTFWAFHYKRCYCGEEFVKRFHRDQVVNEDMVHGSTGCFNTINLVDRRR